MGCVSLETGWYYLDYDEKGKRIAEFYAPAYATEKARRSMVPDYRTTLYWNPTVKLDDTGQATVEFYTSDAPADYDITIEGITQTGKIVRTVKIITE